MYPSGVPSFVPRFENGRSVPRDPRFWLGERCEPRRLAGYRGDHDRRLTARATRRAAADVSHARRRAAARSGRAGRGRVGGSGRAGRAAARLGRAGRGGSVGRSGGSRAGGQVGGRDVAGAGSPGRRVGQGQRTGAADGRGVPPRYSRPAGPCSSSRTNWAASSTGMPSSSALPSLDPAPGPATTKSVFLLTLDADLPPAAMIAS
jgi:hypothetical protein